MRVLFTDILFNLMCTTKTLQRILRRRLPEINRWRKVTVYKWDDPRLPGFITPEDNTFIIYWSGPKRKNIHTDEFREIPMADLDMIADRNRMRLRNKTKTIR